MAGICWVVNCGGKESPQSMTMDKFMAISNVAAALTWLGAAHWFLPELQGNPKYLSWNACSLFMVGIGLFYMSSFYNLYGAFAGGAPALVKGLLGIFIVALCFFFTGVLGLYPEQAWGAHPATKMLMTAMSLAIFVYSCFIYLTIQACKAAKEPWWPIFPTVLQTATIICFLAATVIFDELFDGVSSHPLHDTYNAVFVFKGGAYLFPVSILATALFPTPGPPPPDAAAEPLSKGIAPKPQVQQTFDL